jgi:hypothetical protein
MSSPKVLLHFNQHNIYIILNFKFNLIFPHPLAPLKALHQSTHKAMIHTTHKEYPLSSHDYTPSLKPAHQDHSIITFKITKQTKNKKTRK